MGAIGNFFPSQNEPFHRLIRQHLPPAAPRDFLLRGLRTPSGRIPTRPDSFRALKLDKSDPSVFSLFMSNVLSSPNHFPEAAAHSTSLCFPDLTTTIRIAQTDRSRTSSTPTKQLTDHTRSAIGIKPSQGEDEDQQTVVQENEIKPEMGEKVFQPQHHGFRVQVQTDSVPANPSEEQISGPIKVSPLKDTMEFEGANWRGVTKVECLPSGARFVAPLLFDFPVDAGNANDPIVDSYGKVRYEVRASGIARSICLGARAVENIPTAG